MGTGPGEGGSGAEATSGSVRHMSIGIYTANLMYCSKAGIRTVGLNVCKVNVTTGANGYSMWRPS